MCSHVVRDKGKRKRWRKLRRALLLDRALRQELALERMRDLLLGRALRKLREGNHFKRLGSACWTDYVAQRLGCELRWAQYLVRLDVVLERFPELRIAVESGMLTPLKVIHLSRLFAREMSEENRQAAILAASVLSVRELEAQVRKALAEEKAEGTLGDMESDALNSIPNPWDPGPGTWLSFPAPAKALTMFEASVEAVNRFAGEDVPRHAALEYMVADRFSAIGWPTDMDEYRAESERLRASFSRRAEERARETLNDRDKKDGAAPRGQRLRHEWKRMKRARIDGEYLRRKLLPPELDPDSTDDPHDLDRIVQALEALDHDIRPVLAELLEAFERLGGHELLGWDTFRDYCRESLGLDPRRVTRLMAFRESLGRSPILDAAYREGKLRYLQVLLLKKVVVPETAEAWVQWAMKASMRHTQEVVDKALTLELRGATPEALGAYARLLSGGAKSGTSSPAPNDRGTMFARLANLDDTLPIGVTLPPPPGSRNPILVGLAGDSPIVETVLQYPFRLFLPADVADIIQAGLRSCRDEDGLSLPEGEALAIIASAFLENLDDPEVHRLMEDFPIFERDGWRCTVPTCTRRAYLHRHHIRYRSDIGPDDAWNLTTLCYVHHMEEVHGSLKSVAVSGRAPDDLLWEIGRRAGKPPLLTFRGDRLISDLSSIAVRDSDVRRLRAAFNAAWQARFARQHSPDRARVHA
jgi:hypothetical protein